MTLEYSLGTSDNRVGGPSRSGGAGGARPEPLMAGPALAWPCAALEDAAAHSDTPAAASESPWLALDIRPNGPGTVTSHRDG